MAKNDLRYLGISYEEGKDDAPHLDLATPAGHLRHVPLTHSDLLNIIRRSAIVLERLR